MKSRFLLLIFIFLADCNYFNAAIIHCDEVMMPEPIEKKIYRLYDTAFVSSKNIDKVRKVYFELNNILVELNIFLTLKNDYMDHCDGLLFLGGSLDDDYVVCDNIIATKSFWGQFEDRLEALAAFKKKPDAFENFLKFQKRYPVACEKILSILYDPRSVCRSSDEIMLIKRIIDKDKEARKTSIVKWVDQKSLFSSN